MSAGESPKTTIATKLGARIRAVRSYIATELSQLRLASKRREPRDVGIAPSAQGGHIALAGVIKQFGSEPSGAAAVRGLSLYIPRGQFVTLLGPSGSGKTTVLRLIAGLIVPDSGTIRFDGELVSTPTVMAPPSERGVAMVFQNHGLWPYKTVFENAAFGLARRGRKASEAQRKVANALALVHLKGLEARYPDELSAGERQRVALARALAAEPEILLLDEPLSNLDFAQREQMRGLLKALHRRTGITFVHVTHERTEALALSDRIAVMDHGTLLQFGTPQEVYAQPANRAVAALTGPVNLMSGKITEIRMGVAHIDAGPDLRLEIPVPSETQPGDVLDIAIRPEHIRLTRLLAPPRNGAPAKITAEAFFGNISEYLVKLKSGQVLRVQTHPTQRFAVGDDVSIEVDDAHCMLFRREPLPQPKPAQSSDQS